MKLARLLSSGTYLPAIALLLANAVVTAGPMDDIIAPVNMRNGQMGEIVIDLPSAAGDEFLLSPGGLHVDTSLDLGVEARDVVLAGRLAFAAAGRDGLQIIDTARAAAAAQRAQLKLPASVSLVRADGATAILAGGRDLFVVDVSDPLAPRLRQRYRLEAQPVDLILAGTRAWLLFERELQLLDLAGTSPAVIARVPLTSPGLGLAVTEQQAYIAAGAAGILVFDARAPRSPIATLHTTGPAFAVAARDGRLYVADGDAGVVVFDAQGESEGVPRWLGSFRRIPALKHIAVAGTRALAAAADGGLYLLDVSRPEFPNLLARLPAPARAGAYAVAADTAGVIDGTRLLTYDLRSVPPRLGNEGLDFGQGVNLGGQRRVFIDGDIAYVADWFSGLHLYDISHPRRPRLLSSFHTEGSSKGVTVRDGIAYVADDDHGLQILDVHDPRHPVRVSELATPGLAYTPVLDGNLLYLAAHRGGFVVIDVSDVRAPRLLSHVDTPGKSWSLRVRDGVLYVADDNSGLLVYDVHDPAAPRAIGRFSPNGSDPGASTTDGAAEEVLLDDDRAYVAFFDRGVYVLDIRNPAAPVELGHVATPGNARGLDRRGKLLYIADWMAGVELVDVSDAAYPRIVGGYDTDGAAWGVQLKGDYAYVMDWWGGISVLDVSKSPISRVGGYPYRDTIRALAIQDRFAFVAQGDAGVQVFDIENPLNPIWMTGVDLADARRVVTLNDRAYALHGHRRLAELDIGNPHQTRLIDDLPLAQDPRALYAAGDRLLLTEDHAITLYDPAERKATRYPLAQRISDAGYADGRCYLAEPGRGLVVAVPERGRLKTLAMQPVAGDLRQLRIAGRKAYLAVAGEGVRIFDLNDAAPVEIARIPLATAIDDLELDDTTLYLIAGRTQVYAFDVSDPAHWRLENRYAAPGAVTGLFARGNFIYLTGGETLTALQILPPLALQRGADGKGHVQPTSDLPSGVYDLVAIDRNAAMPESIVRRDAVIVQPLRFGKPKITPEQFKALKEQYLQSHPSP